MDTDSPSTSSSNSSRAGRITTQSHRDSDLCQTNQIPLISPFQIDSLNSLNIGKGTYGHVERVKFRTSRNEEYKLAAVKHANNEKHLLSLIREAKVLMSLQSHPNIIKIYGIYNCPKYGRGVVMEFMDCHSMAELIHNRNIDYSIDHFASWMYQLSSAVEFFHSHDQVHRDLKVQNMLLSNRYRTMKLCDFGTFTELHNSMTSNRGTPITMAPEIFQSQKYDMKCDMFSIGIIMWQILARREPYEDCCEAISLLYNVAMANKRPRELECSHVLSGFYKRCWHQNPDIRPTSKEALCYFKLLTEEYPNGNEPLFDKSTQKPASTPQPKAMNNQRSTASPYSSRLNEPRKTHRRTGSDQTNLKPTPSTSSSIFEVPLIRGTRSKSVASNLMNSESTARNIANLWSMQPDLMPADPDVRDARSLDIYNQHCALAEELNEMFDLQKYLMAAKHHAIQTWKSLEDKRRLQERINYLKSRIEQAELIEAQSIPDN